MNIYNIDKNILIKSSYEAVVTFLEKKYKALGYETVRKYPLDKFMIDLYCKSDREKVFIEIKSREYNKKSFEYINHLQNIIEKRKNAKLLIEYYNYPQKKEININGFDNTLIRQINSKGFNNELLTDMDFEINSEIDSKSIHSYVDEIYYIDIKNININYENIEVQGMADINLRLQFINESNFVEYKNISISFRCNLNKNNEIIDLKYDVKK